MFERLGSVLDHSVTRENPYPFFDS